MAATPCLRHPAHVWMAYCPDCTAWHLDRQITGRSRSARARVPAPPAVRAAR